MKPCEPHGGQGIIKRNVLITMYSDGYVHLVATAGVAPALMSSVQHSQNDGCRFVLHISALVTVWGVATPLKFVHSFHTLLTFAPFTMVGFLRHSWLPLRFL